MNLEIGGIYSFQVYPIAQLGTAFKNVEVLSLMSHRTAAASGMDIQAMHAQMYPSLPAITPNDPTKYNYVEIRMPNGRTQILGLAWIVANTLEVVNLGHFNIRTGSISSSEQAKILNMMAANGIPLESIVFEQST